MGEEGGPMHASHERPLGVSVIAVPPAIKGLASLALALGR